MDAHSHVGKRVFSCIGKHSVLPTIGGRAPRFLMKDGRITAGLDDFVLQCFEFDVYEMQQAQAKVSFSFDLG